jgi:hypothetical protein
MSLPSLMDLLFWDPTHSVLYRGWSKEILYSQCKVSVFVIWCMCSYTSCAKAGAGPTNPLSVGHPEFTPDLIKALLLSRRGVLPDDVIDEVIIFIYVYLFIYLIHNNIKTVKGVSRAHNHIDQKWLADLAITFMSHDSNSTTPFYKGFI